MADDRLFLPMGHHAAAFDLEKVSLIKLEWSEICQKLLDYEQESLFLTKPCCLPKHWALFFSSLSRKMLFRARLMFLQLCTLDCYCHIYWRLPTMTIGSRQPLSTSTGATGGQVLCILSVGVCKVKGLVSHCHCLVFHSPGCWTCNLAPFNQNSRAKAEGILQPCHTEPNENAAGGEKKKATVAIWVSLLVFVCRRLQRWAQAISGLCRLTHMLMIRVCTHTDTVSLIVFLLQCHW